MLSVDEALQRVLAAARPREPVRCHAADALGSVLAEQVTSDVDSPPHDKSIVDGYAVIAADLSAGPANFEILEEVTAGAVPSRTVVPGTTVRIMTGAPLPDGADAVVMVEQSELVREAADGLGTVRLAPPKITVGQNIVRRGASMKRGDPLLAPGHQLRPVEQGVLAEVGRSEIAVVPRPRVAVLATGNELVPTDVVPGPGQIRNSNSPMLVAAARSTGAEARDLGIARDERAALAELISAGLEADVLLLSGGVSAGVLDLVPSVLESLGVEQVFHKVRVKPGKPLWFGVRQREGRQTLVFGLPGNPVSSLVGFELFVRPVIGKLAGREGGVVEITASLVGEFRHRGDRPTYHPAVLEQTTAGATVCPLRWQGSGDLATLAKANVLACFPAGDYTLASGESVPVRPLG